MKNSWIIVVFISCSFQLLAQGGKNSAFSTFNLSATPRAAALGTNFVSIFDADDFQTSLSNVSLLQPEHSGNIMLNFTDYFYSYSQSQVAYAHRFSTLGNVLARVQYVNFGSVDSYDETGMYLGKSKVSYDLMLDFGWSRQLDSSFSIGANFKYMLSALDGFHANSLAVDVSTSYYSREHQFSVSLILRNMGFVLQDIPVENYQRLPFEIQMALSKRLRHAPFRFSLVLTHLERWNLSGVKLTDQEEDLVTGEMKPVNKLGVVADNLVRHLVPGVEFLPFRSVVLRAAYNYQRRQEMATPTRTAMVGFSWGIGLKIYGFHIDYARSAYHLAGAPNYFTVSTNLNRFF